MKIKPLHQNNASGNFLPDASSFSETIKLFIANFPDNAISWIDATQELSTLAMTFSEYLNIPVPTTVVSSPSENNIKWKTFIMDNINKLDQAQQNQILADYDNWFNSELFESSKNDSDSQSKALKDLTLSKNKQFILESGLFFGTINSKKIDNKLSLKWHVDNTFNVDEFIASVRKVVNVAEQDLTDNDVARLVSHYNKYGSK